MKELDPIADFIALRVIERVAALTMTRRVLTLEEAVEYTGVGADGLKAAIATGELPRVDLDRRIRIDILDIERWIQSKKIHG
jgi:excisionase family DNA binding protein